ncbi:MAG: antibiotic biosynthesis monooxygenase [Deltaproteobacteria bacterium]|nr:antibiotic biosynthesis monooxygenase [Deltaproteobacteria bacterium]
MIVTVFRARVREDANLEELGKLTQRMLDIVQRMPGFIGQKDFQAEDGEGLTLVEFDTMENQIRWRDHPEHKAAQELGRKKFFKEYSVQVCELVRGARL